MKKNIYEIFKQVDFAPTDEDKANVLRQNDSSVLRIVLQGAYHPNIKFTLDVPDYRSDDAPPGLGYSNLDTEIKRLYLFVEGSNKRPPGLTKEREKVLLIQILESLESKEAEVLAAMFRKDLSRYEITPEIVELAFPGLLN